MPTDRGLANRRLQPLGHVSARGSAYSFKLSGSNAGAESAESADSGESAVVAKVVTSGHQTHPLGRASQSLITFASAAAIGRVRHHAARRLQRGAVVAKVVTSKIGGGDDYYSPLGITLAALWRLGRLQVRR